MDFPINPKLNPADPGALGPNTPFDFEWDVLEVSKSPDLPR